MLVAEIVVLVPLLACVFIVMARDTAPARPVSRMLHDPEPAGFRFVR